MKIYSGTSKIIFDVDASKDFIYKISKDNSYACETEYNLYKLAEEQGLEIFFVPLIKISNNAFIQKKVQTYAEFRYEGRELKSDAAFVREINQFCESIGYNCEADRRWLYSVYLSTNNDISVVKRLLYFLKINNINDLHNENIGFNLETNAPVIFDYAGYHCSL